MSPVEILDRPDAPAPLVRASLADVRRANALFGGRRAVVAALTPFFERARVPARWTLLDLGTGAGDIPRAAARAAARRGIELVTLGLEHHRAAATLAREAGVTPVVGDLESLPFSWGSVDVVIMSQILHHASRARAVEWVRAADRIARRAVVVADLRRSRFAAWGIWLASFPLAFHPVSRRDGVLSVRRGFTACELTALLERAGIGATARSRPGFRVVAAWEPVSR